MRVIAAHSRVYISEPADPCRLLSGENRCFPAIPHLLGPHVVTTLISIGTPALALARHGHQARTLRRHPPHLCPSRVPLRPLGYPRLSGAEEGVQQQQRQQRKNVDFCSHHQTNFQRALLRIFKKPVRLDTA